MTLERVALRAAYDRGELDKHTYARHIGALHAALTDYAQLIAETDIAAIHVTAAGVVMESRFDGVRFPCDPEDRGIPPVVALNFGAYERKDFDLVRRLVPHGATVLDVGANIGWYALHIAGADPSARVFAFEPVPSSFDWLAAAVRLNGFANVEPLRLAVSDGASEVVLYVDAHIAGAASAAPSTPSDDIEAVRSPAITLDSFAAERGIRADFVKLDIEGGELAALRGAANVLSRDRPIVFSEMLRKLARPFGYHPNDIIALMRGHGFACFRGEDGALVPFEVMDDETVETNFYFLHRERHASLIARFTAATA